MHLARSLHIVLSAATSWTGIDKQIVLLLDFHKHFQAGICGSRVVVHCLSMRCVNKYGSFLKLSSSFVLRVAFCAGPLLKNWVLVNGFCLSYHNTDL